MFSNTFNINDKFNLVTYNKCGSTQIIKLLSVYYNYFTKHNHSFHNNSCNKYNLIRTCAANMLNNEINNSNITYFIIRKHNYRILSYYLSNYNGNLSFEDFVNNLINNKINHNNHLNSYFDTYTLQKFKKIKIIQLNNLNQFFLDKFSMSINNTKIENSSSNFFNTYNKNIEIYKINKNKLKEFNFSRENFFNKKINTDINNFYSFDINLIKNYNTLFK
jgi:hypothetical protein